MNRMTGVKYFISQRLASLVFISALLIRQELSRVRFLIQLTILFKLGLPPFHSWVLRILGELKYAEIWLIFSIQKVIPLIIMSQIPRSNWVSLIVFSLRLMLVGRYVVSNLSLNLIMFISSVVNTLWIMRIAARSLI